MRFWGSVTQGGGRQTALPWAIVSLPLRGARPNQRLEVDGRTDAIGMASARSGAGSNLNAQDTFKGVAKSQRKNQEEDQPVHVLPENHNI